MILLDNDFFGQKNWREILNEAKKENFKICFSQGINLRLINEEIAENLSDIKYFDSNFKTRRLYTAWDNLKDEKIFLRNLKMLISKGIKARNIMVYMLIGFDPKETWEKIFYRFYKMADLGVLPFPMVYNNERKDLKKFQRWAVRGYYRFITWKDFH